jgi:hypothetical protein
MSCPNCSADLLSNQNALFFACPQCNFLLMKNEKGIKQVCDIDRENNYQQVSKFQRWICSTILKHEWSDEGYISARYKERCVKSRVCMRCFESTSKTEDHEFQAVYLHENSCEAMYICKKCGVQDTAKWRTGKSHLWGEWVVDTKNKFPRLETRKCKRCGLSDHRTIGDDTWRQGDFDVL